MKLIKGRRHALVKGRMVEYLLLAMLIAFFFVPVMNLFMMAFSDQYVYPNFLPRVLSLRWWGFVLSQDNSFESLTLSLTVAVVTTMVSWLICIPAAYAFARFEFPFKKVFFFSFLLTNSFPKIGLYVTIGIVFYKLNLMGTFIGVIIIHMLNTMMYMTWIPAAAFKNVRRQQEEAARDVGASPMLTFFHITLPMAAPAIFVASIFTFLSSLEEAQGTMLVGVPNYKTLPVVMYSAIFDYPSTAGSVFAVIIILPSILLYFFINRSKDQENMTKSFRL